MLPSPAQQPQHHLALLDASGFIFRAYYSLPPLTRPDGTPVGAVFGFCNILSKLLADLEADHVAVVFDAGRKNFRHDLYPAYKSNRPDAPEDLIPQFPLVREATRAFNLPAIELAGYEADDVIASYAKAAAERGWRVTIVSADKDMMQLIGGKVGMFDPVKQKPITTVEVMEKFGVSPEKVLDVQALMGDSTDAIPGVPGIGPKTAAELIQQFGSLEALLSQLDAIPQPKRRETLKANVGNARISYELARLCDHAPLPLPLEELKPHTPDLAKLEAFLLENRFTSLLARIKAGAPTSTKAQLQVASAKTVPAYELVTDEARLEAWVARAMARGVVAFDTETSSLNAMQAELAGISLAVGEGEACYIPVGHRGEGDGTLLAANAPKQIPLAKAIALLKPLFSHAGVLKIAHNFKYDALVLGRFGVEDIAPMADTMVMSYALDNIRHRHGLDDLAMEILGHQNIRFEDVIQQAKTIGKEKDFRDVPLPAALTYAAEDADICLRLYQRLAPRIPAEKTARLYERCDRPLTAVLTSMERRGVKVNTARLAELTKDFRARMAVEEATITRLAGREFLLSSPKQMGEILFETLGLPGGKKTKTGAWQTGADVLEDLAEQGHSIAKHILEWRQLAKLCNTYTEALPAEINPKTGRVHSSFNMTVTSTGRLSSTSPNLQNIPIRTSDGRAIRSAFIAEAGHLLLSADYSQIELRLLAHMADIPTLKQAFREGQDIHRLTASQVFGVALADVGADLRRQAKAINFGIIYGMSAFGLSQQLGIGRKEAAEYIDAYFKQYPGIRRYMDNTIAEARARGYVTTLYGRRCYIPGIQDKNAAIRTNAERAAINAPIQGTAADIMRQAMVHCYQALKTQQMEHCLLLQVHDELLLEVPEEKLETTRQLLQRTMEQTAKLDVPLEVETGVGKNWGEAH